MAKFFTILVALIAAWFTVMILGYVAVRLMQWLVRALLHSAAAFVLVSCGAAVGLARLAFWMTRGAIRWAIRRLEPEARLPELPARNAPLFGGLTRSAPAGSASAAVAAVTHRPEPMLLESACGHLNRPEARFCGQCGSPTGVSASAAAAPAHSDRDVIFWLNETAPANRASVAGNGNGGTPDIVFLDEPRSFTRTARRPFRS
jgi:hypothetical protein